MIDGIGFSIFPSAVILIVLIYVHECGHYLVGRRVIGVPRSDITIVMTSVPQFVALRDGEGWVSPFEFERYHEVYRRYDRDARHVTTYASAGFFLQTIAVICLAAVLTVGGVDTLARAVVEVSILITLVYLAYDISTTLYTGTPAGDFSGLWRLSPSVAITVVLLFAVPHGVLFLAL